ncbi:MAG: tryptophan-rich sensory protein [Candidatus Thermoplasmatota archaeon]|nr:tryptophan-rich sensory protein [Candidatus Thermoplasmatota archaeon]
MDDSKKRDIFRLAISIGVCLGVGLLGSIFTTPAIPTWFAGLEKPAFNPPNWLFAPVWTALYVLMGIAFFLVWKKDMGKDRKAYALFEIQLTLNFAWSIVFFGMHSTLGGLVAISLLWVAILLTILRFAKTSKPAAWLLFPYLCWVTFAAILNGYIYALNA